MPRISVVLPVYNREFLVMQAIDSILRQTFTDFELFMIDDCSTDRTMEALAYYAQRDARVKCLPNAEKSSLGKSRNRGIGSACGEFIAFMDSDDICQPDRFMQQVAYLQAHPKVDVCGTNIYRFGVREGSALYPPFDPQIKTQLLHTCPLSNPSVMIRTSTLAGAGVVQDESLFVCEDYAFWVELLPHVTYANVQKELLLYRNNPQSMTQTSIEQEVLRLQRQAIIAGIHVRALELYGFSLGEAEQTLYNAVIGERNLPAPSAAQFALFVEMVDHLVGTYDGRLVPQGVFAQEMAQLVHRKRQQFGLHGQGPL